MQSRNRSSAVNLPHRKVDCSSRCGNWHWGMRSAHTKRCQCLSAPLPTSEKHCDLQFPIFIGHFLLSCSRVFSHLCTYQQWRHLIPAQLIVGPHHFACLLPILPATCCSSPYLHHGWLHTICSHNLGLFNASISVFIENALTTIQLPHPSSNVISFRLYDP